jgi:hypothetical protein
VCQALIFILYIFVGVDYYDPIMRFKIKKPLLLIGGVFILLFVTALLIFLFINNDTQLTLTENIKIKRINFIAKKVARSIKYYDNLPNYYTGKNEFEGNCGDYAILFALKTGANLVIQNQEQQYNIPNGIYKITGRVSKELEDEIKFRISKFSKSGWIGPWWYNKTWPLSLYHPIIGIYSVELIEEKTVKEHFGIDMTYSAPHVWNELNGIIIDISSADILDTPFIGIDTY